MEMCYEGALAMPSSYAVMKEEEMTYVEGGAWSVKKVWYNIVGAAGQWGVFKWICNNVSIKGKSVWAWAVQGVNWAKNTAVSYLAAFCARVGIEMSTVSKLLGVIVGVSTAYAVYYLGTHKVFY